jgi:hydrogenase expression/formation protein HypE
MPEDRILIGHGSGGRLSRELITNLFLKYFNNTSLSLLGDAARIDSPGNRLAFTTDSFVVDPIFFPGGNIGNLAISGTVNDLCVSGAVPKFLTCGFILEEGFPYKHLEQVVKSMAEDAEKAGILIVAGDTKVVNRGQADKLFINTSGIGAIPESCDHLNNIRHIAPGDKLIVSGTLGDHAIAILSARENLQFDDPVISDATPLNHMVGKVLRRPQAIKVMRDITRGGLATVLVEICEGRDFGMTIDEQKIPVKQGVRSMCELYGFDPLYLANEGKILFIVGKGEEDYVLQALHDDINGTEAALIGEVSATRPGKVTMRSGIGGTRIVDMLNGEMLPRIC